MAFTLGMSGILGASVPQFATVAPAGAWTGVAGSGGTAPSDPTRTTAKPAAWWYTPSRQRLSAQTIIGVAADAKGGIASVTFWVEGTTKTVNTPAFYNYTDVNGVARVLYGYFIYLDVATAAAAHATGTVNIYATVTANDGTMQSRVLGPLTFYPRATGVAWSKVVKPSGGGDYTSLVAAFQALNTAAPESAEIILGETNSYELGQATSYYGGHTGYVTLRAAPGITATLFRGASFDPLNATTSGVKAWEWWPWNNSVEFRGAGVVIDMHNWNNFRTNDTNPHWFNGCTITNSAGARDVTYWNNAPPNPLQVNSSSAVVPSYFTDGKSTYVDIDGAAAVQRVNWSALGMLTGIRGDVCKLVANCYETQTDPRTYSTQRNALSVYYTGAGTASIVVTNGANTLDCQVGGVSVGGVFPITLGNNPGATYFTMANVVAAINAIAGGAWHATTLDNVLACWALSQATNTYTPIGTTSGAQTNIVAWIDYHTEWVHTQNTNSENFMIVGNVVRRSYFSTNILNAEHGCQDAVVKNNVFEQVAQQLQNGGWAGSHVVMDENFYDAPFAVYADPDSYSQFSNNVFTGVGFGSESGLVNMPASWVNNVVVTPWPAGAAGSNVTFANYAALTAALTDKVNGDFRPTGTMPTAAHIDAYDGRLNARAATDAMGPWALGYSAPSWPF